MSDPIVDHAPVVTASDRSVAKNTSLAVASLFSVSDADNDTITSYQFWDSSSDATSGHFVINGVTQGTLQAINVGAAQLSQTTFQTGTTGDEIKIRAFDGTVWSDWKVIHLTPAGNHAPVVTATDHSVAANTSLTVSSLFTVSDADNDTITSYRFWDSSADATSGHFVVNGVTQNAGQVISVGATQLSQTTFQTGTTADEIKIAAFDGIVWSDWKVIHLTPPTNHAPVVTASDQSVAANTSLPVTTLFTVSDADNDVITSYRFWDSSSDMTSGHFVVNGVTQDASQVIDVSAADLAQTTFESGTTADEIKIQAFDGTSWGDWKVIHLTPPTNHAPVVTASDESVAKNVSLDASSLFTVSDVDHDAIVSYQFWDSNADATSGHFVVNGVTQEARQVINVSAADLEQTTFQTGTTGDEIKVAAFDGTSWSDWKVIHLTNPSDFHDDHYSDILLRNDDGRLSIWEMDGMSVHTAGTVDGAPHLDASWHIAGTGDFNGDGNSDILLRNDDGMISIWEMNGLALEHGGIIEGAPRLDVSWHIAGTGDFNADGKTDILLRNDDGRVSIWEMNGLSLQQGVAVYTAPLDPSWHIAGTGDFNADGSSDILLYNDDGRVSIWEMNGTSLQQGGTIDGARLDTSWHIAGIGDFNADGRKDILLRNDDGRVSIWQIDGISLQKGGTIDGSNLDPTWHITGTGDVNADGHSDIQLHNDDGRVGIWEMNGMSLEHGGTVDTTPLDPSWHIENHQTDVV